MSTPKEMIDIITELVDESKKRGYAYSTGFLTSVITSTVLGYVPIASRKELIDELRENINYLVEDKKNNGVHIL
jgi:hypothetical protein